MSQTPLHRSSPLIFEEWVNQNPEVQYFTEQLQRQAYQRYLESLPANIPSFEEWLEQNPALKYFSEEKQREVYKKAFPNTNRGLRKLLFPSIFLLFGLAIVGIPLVTSLIKPPILPNDVKLKSSFGMDYKKLRDLLAAEKWEEADEETSRVIEEVIERKILKQKRWAMPSPDINEIPCEDLHTIDQLWVKYSNGRFGFSIQKQIFQAKESKQSPYITDNWSRFQEKVGWLEIKKDNLFSTREAYEEKYGKDIIFNLNAPKGHLPFSAWTDASYTPHDKKLLRYWYSSYIRDFKKFHGNTRRPETLESIESENKIETRENKVRKLLRRPFGSWVMYTWPSNPQIYGGASISKSWSSSNQFPKNKDNCKL